MTKLFYILASGFWLLASVHAATVIGTITDAQQNPLPNTKVIITTFSIPRGHSSGTAVQSKFSVWSDSAGIFTITNAVPGKYQAQPVGANLLQFTFYVADTNATIYVESNLVADAGNTLPPDTMSYGVTASDRRYALKGETGSGTALTNTPNAPLGVVANGGIGTDDSRYVTNSAEVFLITTNSYIAGGRTYTFTNCDAMLHAAILDHTFFVNSNANRGVAIGGTILFNNLQYRFETPLIFIVPSNFPSYWCMKGVNPHGGYLIYDGSPNVTNQSLIRLAPANEGGNTGINPCTNLKLQDMGFFMPATMTNELLYSGSANQAIVQNVIGGSSEYLTNTVPFMTGATWQINEPQPYPTNFLSTIFHFRSRGDNGCYVQGLNIMGAKTGIIVEFDHGYVMSSVIGGSRGFNRSGKGVIDRCNMDFTMKDCHLVANNDNICVEQSTYPYNNNRSGVYDHIYVELSDGFSFTNSVPTDENSVLNSTGIAANNFVIINPTGWTPAQFVERNYSNVDPAGGWIISGNPLVTSSLATDNQILFSPRIQTSRKIASTPVMAFRGAVETNYVCDTNSFTSGGTTTSAGMGGAGTVTHWGWSPNYIVQSNYYGAGLHYIGAYTNDRSTSIIVDTQRDGTGTWWLTAVPVTLGTFGNVAFTVEDEVLIEQTVTAVTNFPWGSHITTWTNVNGTGTFITTNAVIGTNAPFMRATVTADHMGDGSGLSNCLRYATMSIYSNRNDNIVAATDTVLTNWNFGDAYGFGYNLANGVITNRLAGVFKIDFLATEQPNGTPADGDRTLIFTNGVRCVGSYNDDDAVLSSQTRKTLPISTTVYLQAGSSIQAAIYTDQTSMFIYNASITVMQLR